MRNISVAFKIIDKEETIPLDYKYVGLNVVYDVKLDLRRKACLVAEGHNTPDPVASTYAGVVSRESVCIALTHEALHSLDLCSADIGNAYLQAPTSEKYYTKLGKEFGEYVGRRAYVICAAHGLKSAGADFQNHLRDCIKNLGFKYLNADNDVWMKKTYGPNNITYYEYVIFT